MLIQETIKDIKFFEELDDNQINILASISRVTNYPKKSILYYESESTNKFKDYFEDGARRLEDIPEDSGN